MNRCELVIVILTNHKPKLTKMSEQQKHKQVNRNPMKMSHSRNNRTWVVPDEQPRKTIVVIVPLNHRNRSDRTLGNRWTDDSATIDSISRWFQSKSVRTNVTDDSIDVSRKCVCVCGLWSVGMSSKQTMKLNQRESMNGQNLKSICTTKYRIGFFMWKQLCRCTSTGLRLDLFENSDSTTFHHGKDTHTHKHKGRLRFDDIWNFLWICSNTSILKWDDCLHKRAPVQVKWIRRIVRKWFILNWARVCKWKSIDRVNAVCQSRK